MFSRCLHGYIFGRVFFFFFCSIRSKQQSVWSKINFLVGPQGPPLATVKRWKLAWFGHVAYRDNLSKATLQALREVDAMAGRGSAGWTTSKSGNPCPCQIVHNGLLQKRLEEDFCWIIPPVPMATQSVKGLNWTELNLQEKKALQLFLIWAGYSDSHETFMLVCDYND